MTTAAAVIREWEDAINAGDVDRLTDLMTPNHRFTDGLGNVVTGRDAMADAWRRYFSAFADYRIEVETTAAAGNTVLLSGYASGSFANNRAKAWRIPAAWRAVVSDGRLAEWQVYADTSPILALSKEDRTD